MFIKNISPLKVNFTKTVKAAYKNPIISSAELIKEIYYWFQSENANSKLYERNKEIIIVSYAFAYRA